MKPVDGADRTTVIYRDVWAGADLISTIYPGGVKKNVILQNWDGRCGVHADVQEASGM